MRTFAFKFQSRGSTLVVALVLMALLSLVAGQLILSVISQVQVRSQGSAWQEAILAAEGGVDLALGELTRNAMDPLGADWAATGWKKLAPREPGRSGETGEPANGKMLQPNLNGQLPAMSDTIVLDNVQLKPSQGESTTVADVQLTAIWPDPGEDLAAPKPPVWFRIRSLGTARIYGNQNSDVAPEESSLRRVNMQSLRNSRRGDDNLVQSVQLPSVSRSVEVIARPVSRFSMALCARFSCELPINGKTIFNSYANLANALPRPPFEGKADIGTAVQSENNSTLDLHWNNALSEPMVNGNFYSSKTSESVLNPPSEEDSWRQHYVMFEQSERDLRPPRFVPIGEPQTILPDADPTKRRVFTAGSASAPKTLVYQGDLPAIKVKADENSANGSLTIFVKGNLIPKSNDGDPAIQIEANVRVHLIVEGDRIDLGSEQINTSGAADPSNLRIWGVGGSKTPPQPDDDTRQILLNGEANLNGVIYAPYYNLKSSGGGDGIWKSSIIANEIDLSNGGPRLFLFPEALLDDQEVERYEITRYFEDTRG